MQKTELELSDPESLPYFYFMVHISISAILFYLIVSWIGITQFNEIILNLAFLINIFYVFIISIFCSIAGRYFGYLVIRIIAERVFQKKIKKWRNFLGGINGMPRSFFIATIISAVIFVGGLLESMRDALLGDDSFIATFGAYVLMELVIFILSRLIDLFLRGRK